MIRPPEWRPPAPRPPKVRILVRTGDLDLPVEVRDPRMRLIDQGLSGRSPNDWHGQDIHLDPGTYIVSVRLPGGRTLAEAINLQADKNQSVDLRPDREWLLPRVRYSTDMLPVAGPTVAQQAPGWTFRFLQLEGLSLASPISIKRISQVPESAPGSSTFEIETFGPGVIFAQFARPAEIPLNVALLPGRKTGCLLTVEEQAGTVYASALPGGKVAVERAAQFLAAGEDQHAALLITRKETKSLLKGKRSDPIRAAIGGYALLRLNELKGTQNWTENLASWFPWLPDGAVITGEKAAMLGDHQRALDYFLRASERGLPLFTDGFSILVSRLRQYEANPHIRAQLTEKKAAEVRTLLAELERWSPFVDFSALTLTFRAALVTDPGGSQNPVEIDDQFYAWH